MPHHPTSGTLTAIVMALTVTGASIAQTEPAAPQPEAAPPADTLRADYDRLNAQVRDLTRELSLAQETIRTQRATIARLERQLANPRRPSEPDVPGSAPAPDEQVTIDESDPAASPRAMFKAIVASYEEATDDLQVGDENDAIRRAYMRTLESWRAATVRKHRTSIQWHVRVVGAKPGPERNHTVTMVAVDPVTDVRLGQPFDVVLPQSMVNRLAIWEMRGGLGVLVMKGTFTPDIQINENRETRGTFDNPQFIGPFAEFGFRVEVSGFKRAIAAGRE